MSDPRPIVLDRDTGKTKELAKTDDLDIPLRDRVSELENKLKLLCRHLNEEEGIDIPEEIYE